MQKVSIVIPCYNEEQNIAALLSRINSLATQLTHIDLSVLIVNDGSTDKTEIIARDFPSSQVKKEILNIHPNKGLANALFEGFKKSINQLKGNDIIVILDGDDSHHPALIESMIAKINEASDIVIASRFQKDSEIIGLSSFRKFTGWAASMLFRVTLPIKNVKDYTCGFRAYKVSIIQNALSNYGNNFIEEKGFACMAEILIKLSKIGANVCEVPMVLRYDRKQGESKMKVGKTIKQSLKLIAKNIFSK